MKHDSSKPLTPGARSLLRKSASVFAEVFAEDADQIAIAAKYAERCEDPTRRILALALRELEKNEYGHRPGAGSPGRQLYDAGALEMMNQIKPFLRRAIRALPSDKVMEVFLLGKK